MSGIRDQVSGLRYQGSGIRNQIKNIRDQNLTYQNLTRHELRTPKNQKPGGAGLFWLNPIPDP
jgi:hypothetical protein